VTEIDCSHLIMYVCTSVSGKIGGFHKCLCKNTTLVWPFTSVCNQIVVPKATGCSKHLLTYTTYKRLQTAETACVRKDGHVEQISCDRHDICVVFHLYMYTCALRLPHVLSKLLMIHITSIWSITCVCKQGHVHLKKPNSVNFL